MTPPAFTFADAVEIVSLPKGQKGHGSSRDHAPNADAALLMVAAPELARAERYEALKAKHGVGQTGATFPEQSPEEANAEKWDRFNEPSPRFDDGYDVERWAGAGR
jgi:hypothetical protein